MSLLSLPSEILHLITESLDYASDVSALAQTCQPLRQLGETRLYGHFAKEFPQYSPRGLQRVVKNGNAAAVRRMIQVHPGIVLSYYSFSTGHWSPVFLAALHGHVEVVRAFVEVYGPQIVTMEPFDERGGILNPRPLECAAVHGHVDVMRFLVTTGVRPFIRFSMTNNLNGAVEKFHSDSIRYLVEEAKCHVNGDAYDPLSPLFRAARLGRLDVVKILIEAGADPQNRNYFLPLWVAVKGNHESVVRYFLENDMYPNLQEIFDARELLAIAAEQASCYGSIGSTPSWILERVDLDAIVDASIAAGEENWSLLSLAAALGDQSTAERFLAIGCPVHTDDRSSSPLLAAGLWGNLPVVKYLLDKLLNTNPESMETAYYTLIKRASYVNNDALVRVILDHGKESLMKKASYYVLVHQELQLLAPLLMERGALTAVEDTKAPFTGIRIAMKTRNHTFLQRLLELYEIDLLDRRDNNYSVLRSAGSTYDGEGFRMLLKRGVTLDKENSECNGALNSALCFQNCEIVDIFLDHGWPVDFTMKYERYEYDDDRDGSSPLLCLAAMSKGSSGKCGDEGLALTRLLLARGAKVDIEDSHHRTPLHCAVRGRRMSVIRELLDHGADPLAKSFGSMNALQCAVEKNVPELVGILVEAMSARGRACDNFIRYIPSLPSYKEWQAIEKSSADTGDLSLLTRLYDKFDIVKIMRKHHWRMMYPIT